jgi:hypothetical protein
MFHVKHFLGGVPMIPELDVVFKKYEALVDQVDDVFEQVRQQYPECVTCKLGCADCCHAIFDLSLVEALYINRRFLEKVVGQRKIDIIEDANVTDRNLYRMKRKAFKSVEDRKKNRRTGSS